MAIDHPTGQQGVSLGWLWLLAVLAVLWVVVPGCAAQRHMDRGMDAWKQGDAPQARYHLEQAVTLDRKLGEQPEVREALRQATRDSEMLLGQRAEQRRRWDQAVQHYAAAVAADPQHPPAQRALEDNRERHVRQLFDAAMDQADEAHLDGAAVLLRQVLRQRPDHARAIEALASLEAGASTPTLTAEAQHASEQGEWDRAEALLNESIEAQPLHLPTRAQRHTLRSRAADDMHARARAALQAGDLDASARFFKQIQRYRARDVRTRRGLADVALRRSDDAYAQGDAALSWLHAREAFAQVPQDAQAQERVERSVATLTESHRPTLSLRADASFTEHHDTLTLLDATRQQLTGSTLVMLLHKSDSPIGDDGCYHADASLRVEAIDIETRLLSRETLMHAYEVLEEAPNPKLPRLARCVSDAADELRSLSRRERRLCGELSKAEAAGDACLSASLRDQLSDLRRRIDRADRSLRSAQHALDCAPATITIRQPHSRPYTVETHLVTGVLRGAWRWADGETVPMSSDFVAQDRTVIDPDPSIGLGHDALELPGEPRVRELLIDRAADDLSSRLSREARLAAVDRLLHDASAESADNGSSRRVRVAAAAALLRPLDADGAKSLIATLDPPTAQTHGSASP